MPCMEETLSSYSIFGGQAPCAYLGPFVRSLMCAYLRSFVVGKAFWSYIKSCVEGTEPIGNLHVLV